jgi:hypothetical protein
VLADYEARIAALERLVGKFALEFADHGQVLVTRRPCADVVSIMASLSDLNPAPLSEMVAKTPVATRAYPMIIIRSPFLNLTFEQRKPLQIRPSISVREF